MMKVDPRIVMRLIKGLGGLMETAVKIPTPEITDDYILTPEQSKSDFYVVVCKAGFKTEQGAKDFMSFNNQLDEMF